MVVVFLLLFVWFEIDFILWEVVLIENWEEFIILVVLFLVIVDLLVVLWNVFGFVLVFEVEMLVLLGEIDMVFVIFCLVLFVVIIVVLDIFGGIVMYFVVVFLMLMWIVLWRVVFDIFVNEWLISFMVV